MKNLIFAFIFNISSISLCLADGEWQGIPFGASKNEILKNKQSLNIVEVPKQSLGKQGDYSELTIDDYVIGRSSFKVVFVSGSADKLKNVSISLKETSNKYIVKNTMGELEQSLTEKYGQPIFKDESSNSSGGNSKRVWQTSKSKISLNFMQFYETVFLILNYEEPTSDSNNNL